MSEETATHEVAMARSPIAWQYPARQLKRIAEMALLVSSQTSESFPKEEWLKLPFGGRMMQIGYDIQLFDVYYLLMGFAVENLAKGLLVRRDPDLIDPKGAIRRPLKTHDLVGLVDAAIGLDDEIEEQLLARLTEYVVWRGRYTYPTLFASRMPGKHFERLQKLGFGHFDDQVEKIEAIFDKLWDALSSLDPNYEVHWGPWISPR